MDATGAQKCEPDHLRNLRETNAETAGARLGFRCPQLGGTSRAREAETRAERGTEATPEPTQAEERPQPARPSHLRPAGTRCAASADLTRPQIRTFRVRRRLNNFIFYRICHPKTPEEAFIIVCVGFPVVKFYCCHVKMATSGRCRTFGLRLVCNRVSTLVGPNVLVPGQERCQVGTVKHQTRSGAPRVTSDL